MVKLSASGRDPPFRHLQRNREQDLFLQMLREGTNRLFTGVGPGTAMGGDLRRYWHLLAVRHAVAAALELSELADYPEKGA